VAVLDRRKGGKESIRLFVGIRYIGRVDFGAPSDRKGVAQFGRVKAQVNVGLDGKDSNLRHLNCSITDIRGG